MTFSGTRTNTDPALSLEVSGLSVSYGKRNILNGVSLSFYAGLHFITGLNGSGKSTLFRAITAAVPYSGKITLGTSDLSLLSPAERARQIALLHQQSSQAFPITVSEYVLMGRFPWLGWTGLYSREDKSIARQSLEALQLETLSDALLGELSGGELQKTHLARALCQQSPVLLLDEPEQSLDPANKNLLFDLLLAQPATGKIVICTTHEQSWLEHPGVNVVGLRNGQLSWRETAPFDMSIFRNAVYGL